METNYGMGNELKPFVVYNEYGIEMICHPDYNYLIGVPNLSIEEGINHIMGICKNVKKETTKEIIDLVLKIYELRTLPRMMVIKT